MSKSVVIMRSNNISITVLIMAQNEELNIRQVLDSVVGHCDQVIVTDAFSADRTRMFCKSYKSVELYVHQFEDWAAQRNWMLANCNIRNDTVFFLDADEYVDEAFLDELNSFVSTGHMPASVSVNIRYVFLNKVLRFAYRHRPVQRIFKRQGLSFSGEGAREYAHMSGDNITMKSRITHHDRKPIAAWITRHNNNADRESVEYLRSKQKGHYATKQSNLLFAARVRLTIRKLLWDRMPLFYRSMFFFIYRYFLRCGFLDGRAGAIYCFLYAHWYMALVDIKVIERLRTGPDDIGSQQADCGHD